MFNIKALVHILFPDFCSVCGSFGQQICPDCIVSLNHSTDTESLGIFAPLHYADNRVKSLLQSLKTRNDITLGTTLGNYLYESSREYISDIMTAKNMNSVIICPIPLNSHRLRDRGYNQSDLITVAFAHKWCREYTTDIDTVYIADLLEKVLETKKQSTLQNRTQRIANVQGSFMINKKYLSLVHNKTVIVIDDISTTGATLSVAKDALEKAATYSVILMAIAH
jgi:competence protein ComFC